MEYVDSYLKQVYLICYCVMWTFIYNYNNLTMTKRFICNISILKQQGVFKIVYTCFSVTVLCAICGHYKIINITKIIYKYNKNKKYNLYQEIYICDLFFLFLLHFH